MKLTVLRAIGRISRRVGLAAVLALGASAQAQPADDSASREAFRVCDARAFLALNIARNYLMTDRNRQAVIPPLNGDAAAEAVANALMQRIDDGAIRTPGDAAAEALFECAAEQKVTVGASPKRVSLCFTRTDVPFFLHIERSNKVVRQLAVSRVQARLKSRELYPTELINQVAEAMYAPAQLPDLRRLMGAVAWGCIHPPASTASAASR